MSPYRHVPHPHILHRKAAQPAKVADQFSRGSAIEALEIQEHLLSQDRELEKLITALGTARD